MSSTGVAALAAALAAARAAARAEALLAEGDAADAAQGLSLSSRAAARTQCASPSRWQYVDGDARRWLSPTATMSENSTCTPTHTT